MLCFRRFWTVPVVALAASLIALVSWVPAASGGSTRILVIGGTGSALEGMRMLAEKFMDANRDVVISIRPSLGSAGGIRAIKAGKIDLAVTTRPLHLKERSSQFEAIEYAQTPLVFATRIDTTAEDINTDQLTAIFLGDNGWPDGARMRLVMRPHRASDNKLLCGLSDDMDKAVRYALKRRQLLVTMNDQENASALESIPGSFGMTTLAQILTEKRKLKPLSFNGVSGTPATLAAKSYPFAKRLHYVVSSDPSPDIKAFIEFLNSDVGQEILTTHGHLTAVKAN